MILKLYSSYVAGERVSGEGGLTTGLVRAEPALEEVLEPR